MQPEELRRILAERVRARRKELGITQYELADKLGVKQPYVAQIERTEEGGSPTLQVVARLAEALQTSPSALLAAESVFSPISS